MPSTAIAGHMLIRRELLVISATIAIALAIYIPNIHISFNNWDMDAYRRVLYAENPQDMAWRLEAVAKPPLGRNRVISRMK